MGSEQKKTFYKRGIFAVGVIALVFIVLIGWLFNIQIIKGDELASKQESYILTNINITAERGDIYDRNMNILAKDATCSMVYAFPGEVSDPEGVAKYISELLNINYNDVLKKLTNTSLSYVVIQRGIENTAASKIMEQGFAGIGTSEDKKRNYSDTEFASYILGFTGTDHSGLYGIESTMNSILSGEDGIRSVLVDANGRVIESSSNIKKEAVQGGSIVLTIDSVIQYYAESAVYEAYLKNEPRRAMAIVMNPQTGEILAMAGKQIRKVNDEYVDPGYVLQNKDRVKNDVGNNSHNSGNHRGGGVT